MEMLIAVSGGPTRTVTTVLVAVGDSTYEKRMSNNIDRLKEIRHLGLLRARLEQLEQD
jgi:hypothetical protein